MNWRKVVTISGPDGYIMILRYPDALTCSIFVRQTMMLLSLTPGSSAVISSQCKPWGKVDIALPCACENNDEADARKLVTMAALIVKSPTWGVAGAVNYFLTIKFIMLPGKQ